MKDMFLEPLHIVDIRGLEKHGPSPLWGQVVKGADGYQAKATEAHEGVYGEPKHGVTAFQQERSASVVYS